MFRPNVFRLHVWPKQVCTGSIFDNFWCQPSHEECNDAEEYQQCDLLGEQPRQTAHICKAWQPEAGNDVIVHLEHKFPLPNHLRVHTCILEQRSGEEALALPNLNVPAVECHEHEYGGDLQQSGQESLRMHDLSFHAVRCHAHGGGSSLP